MQAGITLVGSSSLLSGEGSSTHTVSPQKMLLGMGLIIASQVMHCICRQSQDIDLANDPPPPSSPFIAPLHVLRYIPNRLQPALMTECSAHHTTCPFTLDILMARTSLYLDGSGLQFAIYNVLWMPDGAVAVSAAQGMVPVCLQACSIVNISTMG